MLYHLDLKKYGLAIHTSSPQLGLALSNFAGDRRSNTWDLGREISTHLQLILTEFLSPQTWEDLTFIAVANGPGSFTGTRTGVVTARTIAQQLDIPLFAISTLEGIAQSISNREAIGKLAPKAIAIQMPAQRGQLFVAIYQPNPDSSLTPLLSDCVMNLDKWKQALNSLNQPYQVINVTTEFGNTVSNLLELAYIKWQKGNRPHWSEALPFYGQHPVEDKASS